MRKAANSAAACGQQEHDSLCNFCQTVSTRFRMSKQYMGHNARPEFRVTRIVNSERTRRQYTFRYRL